MDKDIGLELDFVGEQGDIDEMLCRIDDLVEKYGYKVRGHGPWNYFQRMCYLREKYRIEQGIGEFLSPRNGNQGDE